MKSVVILGAGRVGQTLGYLLQYSSKYKVTALWNQSRISGQRAAKFIGGKVLFLTKPAQAARLGEIVFITTPDNIIKDLCYRIACRKGFRRNTLVVHCSGNFSSEILISAQRFCGCRVASLHPLQSFAQPGEAVNNFRGTYCAYEGMAEGLSVVRKLIRDLGGIPVKINAAFKPLYHISGVIASNYLVTLLAVAREFMRVSGFPEKNALDALMPLVKSTIKNIKELGIPAALTGPIARGDFSTVQNHLVMTKKYLRRYQSFYQMLGKHTIKVAKDKKSISNIQARVFYRLFDKNMINNG